MARICQSVRRLADALIEQRSFSWPVGTYYEAATAALASQQPIAHGSREDQSMRDVLERLVRELNARWPWAEPPYRIIGSDRWTELVTAPTIGRIRLSRLSVGEHLNGLFEPVPGTGDQPVNVLVLRLGSGEQVALVAPESFTEPRVTVRAHGDGPSTRDALRELTGLDIETG